MKKNLKYEVVNNQEDEDGYSSYPDSSTISESAKEKQAGSSNKNTKPVAPKHALVSMEARERISQRIISPSAKLAGGNIL
jgi:hypothetical protein